MHVHTLDAVLFTYEFIMQIHVNAVTEYASSLRCKVCSLIYMMTDKCKLKNAISETFGSVSAHERTCLLEVPEKSKLLLEFFEQHVR